MPGRFNSDPYVSLNFSHFPLVHTERRYYSTFCQIGNHKEWKSLVPLPLFRCVISMFFHTASLSCSDLCYLSPFYSYLYGFLIHFQV
jgi:hypothetical protein